MPLSYETHAHFLGIGNRSNGNCTGATSLTGILALASLPIADVNLWRLLQHPLE